MTDELWGLVDGFLDEMFPPDPALESVLRESRIAGLPAIQVSAAYGRFLHLLARMRGARTILEIGTLGGYSTIWLARALPPGGRVVTLEMEHAHAQVAHRNLVIAGVADAVDIRIGPALDTLAELEQEQPDGFDMIFIDADKEAYPAYWKCSMKLAHEGTLILADNVVREGLVADRETHDPRALGAREYLELVAAEPRVTSAVLQTVGSKGYDGLSLAIVGARE